MPKTLDEMAAEIEAAFRKLPIAPTPSGAISYETLIPGIPRQLILMLPHPKIEPIVDEQLSPKIRDSKLWRLKFGRRKVAGTATANKELAELGKRAEALVLAINGLSQTAVEALGLPEAALNKLKASASLLWIGATKANVHELPDNTAKGAPPKVQERRIAWCVAWHYHFLTGLNPTVPDKNGRPYGPFFELLQAIYEALEVTASAAAQGRLVEEIWHCRTATGLKEKSR